MDSAIVAAAVAVIAHRIAADYFVHRRFRSAFGFPSVRDRSSHIDRAHTRTHTHARTYGAARRAAICHLCRDRSLLLRASLPPFFCDGLPLSCRVTALR